MPNLDICFRSYHRTSLLELVLKVSSESINPKARILASAKTFLRLFGLKNSLNILNTENFQIALHSEADTNQINSK